MQVSNAIDCNGLSVAPTLLRIKQALIGRSGKGLPLNILVGADFDRDHLAVSLGDLAGDVRLVTRAD